MSKGWDQVDRNYWHRNIRPEILNANKLNNNGQCQLAIPDVCTGTATQVHHTLGVQVTGMDRRYLQAVCGPCNRAIGDPAKRSDPVTKTHAHWQ